MGQTGGSSWPHIPGGGTGMRRPPTTARLRLAPQDPRGPLAYGDDGSDGRWSGQGDDLCRPEPGYLDQWLGTAVGDAQARLARRQGQLADRDGDALVRRARGRGWHRRCGRYPDRGLLLPFDADRRVRWEFHEYSAAFAVALQGCRSPGRLSDRYLVLLSSREEAKSPLR